MDTLTFRLSHGHVKRELQIEAGILVLTGCLMQHALRWSPLRLQQAALFPSEYQRFPGEHTLWVVSARKFRGEARVGEACTRTHCVKVRLENSLNMFHSSDEGFNVERSCVSDASYCALARWDFSAVWPFFFFETLTKVLPSGR